jgi:hypothetical protein
MNHRVVGICIAVLIGCGNSASAQWKELPLSSAPEPCMSGDFRSDILLASSEILSSGGVDSGMVASGTGKKYSPLKAGLFSAVVPGAGQLYTENYWQSAAFFAAEVGLWILYLKYDAKGDHQTDYFQKYADAHWSVVQYVEWIKTYYPTAYADALSKYPNFVNASTAMEPWDRVSWQALNYCESEVGETASTGFSHTLPVRPSESYYELIGKYPQFAGGWDDASDITAADVANNKTSPRLLLYSAMRGDANTYYNIATAMSYLLVANHVFGAMEAAWNAANENHKMHIHTSLKPQSLDGYTVCYTANVKMQIDF